MTKGKILIALILTLIFSCKLDSEKKEDSHIKLNLLNECENITFSKGRIQGLENIVSKDSLVLIFFAECHDSSGNFYAQFAPLISLEKWKKKIRYKTLDDYFAEERRNNFKNFDIYFFEMKVYDPLIDNNSVKNDWPQTIRIIRASNNKTWDLGEFKINNSMDFSLLRFKAFFRKL